MDYRLLLLVALYALPGAEAYARGAPRSVCESMTPSHGSRASIYTNRNSDIPILVKGDGTYSPGQRLDVEIKPTSSWRTFKGFFLQARRVSGDTSNPVGTFTPRARSSTKLECANGALTHSTSRVRRSSVRTSWTAPREAVGDIMFVATVVESYSKIYVNLTSEIILDSTIIQETNAQSISPASHNGTAVIDPSICAEDLLLPLPLERPHVAILCRDDAQCPCSWRCCSRCDATTATCEGHAICRQPRATNETATVA